MKDLISIGHTGKSHGLKGEIRLNVSKKYNEALAQLEVIFIALEGKPVPFFVEYIKNTNLLLAKFEDFESKESLKKISSKEVFVQASDLEGIEEEVFDTDLVFGILKGFEVIDEELGSIGVIEEIIEFPQQEMGIISYKEREVMIPLNGDYILQIHHEKQQVQVKLPHGLLEL